MRLGPPPSRRRLLSSTMQHDAASTHQKQPSELDADDSSIDDAELLLDDDFNILNNVRTMKGGSYFPRTITRTRVVHFSTTRQSCFNSSSKLD